MDNEEKNKTESERAQELSEHYERQARRYEGSLSERSSG